MPLRGAYVLRHDFSLTKLLKAGCVSLSRPTVTRIAGRWIARRSLVAGAGNGLHIQAVIALEEILGHGLDAGLAGHEHIHLAGEDEQAPDEDELFLDHRVDARVQKYKRTVRQQKPN